MGDEGADATYEEEPYEEEVEYNEEEEYDGQPETHGDELPAAADEAAGTVSERAPSPSTDGAGAGPRPQVVVKTEPEPHSGDEQPKRKRTLIQFPAELEANGPSAVKREDDSGQGAASASKDAPSESKPQPPSGPPGRLPLGRPRAPPGRPPPSGARYFGMRSMSLENVLVSVQTDLWATTKINAEKLSREFNLAQERRGQIVLFFTVNNAPFVAGFAVMRSDVGAVKAPSPFGSFPGKLFRVEWQFFGEFMHPLFQNVKFSWQRPGVWTDGTAFPEHVGDEMCAIIRATARANNLAPPKVVAGLYAQQRGVGGPPPVAMMPPAMPPGPRPPLRPPQSMHSRLARGEAAVPGGPPIGGYGGVRGVSAREDQGRFLGFDDALRYEIGPGLGMPDGFGMGLGPAPPHMHAAQSHLGMPPHLSGIDGRALKRARSRSPDGWRGRGHDPPPRRKHLSDLSHDEYLSTFSKVKSVMQAQPQAGVDPLAVMKGFARLLNNPQILNTLGALTGGAGLGAGPGRAGAAMGATARPGGGLTKPHAMTEDEYVIFVRQKGFNYDESFIRQEYRKTMQQFGLTGR